MQLLLSLLVNAAALIITDWLIPGFRIDSFTTAIVAAIVLGVINTFIKPVLVLLTLPLSIMTLGLFIFIVNAVVLWLATLVVPGMTIDGPLDTIIAALVLSVVSTILSSVINKD